MSLTTAFDHELAAELAASSEPLPLLRQWLKRGQEALDAHFHAGEEVSQLVHERALLIDGLLRQAWRHTVPAAGDANALIAVGGYGRGELHPRSDVDIMILLDREESPELREQLVAYLTLLWDVGLEVGHSVRTLDDCIREATADITVATNLMEARLLDGATALFEAMREAVGPDHIWPGRDFFEAKWREQIARHRKFHDTAYNLEPNVKEGPGALRDIQMIGWVAKRHFGADTLHDLVGHGFLSEEEYRLLDGGQRFLWRVRYGLHLLTGRREDRLLFDHQRSLAREFGYPGNGPRLAVEQFMKDYYRTVMELERLNEMLLQLFQEEILYADDSGEPQPLNKRFQARKGFIEVTHERVFQRYPFALLEIFLLLAQHPELKGVRAGTIRLLRRNRHRIDDAFRNDLRARSLFIEILRQPRGTTLALRRMNRYGILGAYLPEFGQIVGQMQHDLFHVYTVDEHTLTVVRNLRRLAVSKFRDEFPLCSEIMQRLPKPELSVIIALYHDVAKGRGGDHSELGAVDAEEFCRRHALSDYDTRLVTWVVRHHLIMSTTAQRQDIADPEVINAFAQKVGDQAYLDYLYLHTVADVRATGPSVWNSWKAALMAELYHRTRRALRRGLANPIHEADLINDTRHDARVRLHEHGLDDSQIDTVWARLPTDYFLRYSADEVAWHTAAIHGHANPEQPLVVVRRQARPAGAGGGASIFIHTALRSFLFTAITTTLEQLGLNILDARIIPSTDEYTLDGYVVLEQDREPIKDAYRIQEIEQALRQVLEAPEQAPPPLSHPPSRQHRHFPIKTRVRFEEDPNSPRTVLEVVATDRPGLLSRIAHALGRCHVHMHGAKIATIGERAEDIFFVTDDDQRPLDREERQACLREEILRSLEG